MQSVYFLFFETFLFCFRSTWKISAFLSIVWDNDNIKNYMNNFQIISYVDYNNPKGIKVEEDMSQLSKKKIFCKSALKQYNCIKVFLVKTLPKE